MKVCEPAQVITDALTLLCFAMLIIAQIGAL